MLLAISDETGSSDRPPQTEAQGASPMNLIGTVLSAELEGVVPERLPIRALGVDSVGEIEAMIRTRLQQSQIAEDPENESTIRTLVRTTVGRLMSSRDSTSSPGSFRRRLAV